MVIASIVASVAILLLLFTAYVRLEDNGQFEAAKWRPFRLWAVHKFFLLGLVNTVKVALTAMVIAIAIGALMALGRLARNPPIRWLSGLYVEFFRGLPLYLLLLFCWLGLPSLDQGPLETGDLKLDTFWVLVAGLSIYNSSVLAEIFRAGILSLERGQSEASYAIGLGYWRTMRYVVVPQAVRRMVPAIISQLVTLLKDSSLGILIGYEELLRRSRINYDFYQNPLQSLAYAAVLYIIVNATLSKVATRLEARQRRRYAAGSITVTGVEDLAVVGASADADLSVTGDTP